MVNHEIFLTNGSETVAGMIADAFGITGIVRHEFEIRPIQTHQLRQFVEREHAVDQEDLVIGARQRPLHEPTQFHRHGGFELEANDRSAPSALEDRLELAHQIFGLFLDLDLGITNDAEGALPLDRVTGKKAGDEKPDHLLERDHPGGGRSLGTRQADEALDLVRHADERVHRLAVARARQVQRDGEAEVGNERKWMRGIDGERGQQRENLPKEMVFEPGLFFFRHIRRFDQHDALLGQHLPQLAPALLLIACQHADGLSDAGELFRRSEPIRALDRNAGALLALEAGNADHEEFIEVVGGNRQKPNTLEQGMGVVCRLLEYSAVELEPRQLAIDEPFRAREELEGGRSLGAGRDRVSPGFLFHNNDLAAVSHGPKMRMRSATPPPSSLATHLIRPRHSGAVKAKSRAGFRRQTSWLTAACAAWPRRRGAPPPRAPPQMSVRSAWPRSRSGLRRPRVGGQRTASPAPRARVRRRAPPWKRPGSR